MYELPSPSCKRMATSGTFCRKTLTLFARLMLLSSIGICSQLLLWSKNPVFSFNFTLREEAQTQRKKVQVLQFQIPFVAHPALNIL